MAEAVTIAEFLAVLGYRVDEGSQRKFSDAIGAMTKQVELLGAGIAAAAAGVVTAIAKMAASSEQMYYLGQRVGETVANIDALVFSISKLGVVPESAVKNIQALGDALRMNPGYQGLFNHLAGGPEGTLTEKLTRFGERLAHATDATRRVMMQQGQQLGLSMDFMLGLARNGLREGEGHFNLVQKLFDFDPNKFAEQSKNFLNAFRDLKLDLDTILGSISTKVIDNLTSALQALDTFLLSHSKEIIGALVEIKDEFHKAFDGAATLVSNIVTWFDHLTGSQREAAAAIALIGAAFGGSGWLRIAAISIVIEKLLTDYEKFNKTGVSDMGVPWKAIGAALDEFVKKFDELNKATNNWFSVWHIFEAYMVYTFSKAVIGVLLGIATTATTTAGVITKAFGGVVLGGWVGQLISLAAALGGIPAALALTLHPNPTQTKEQEKKSLDEHGGALHPGRQVPAGTPVGPTPGSHEVPSEFLPSSIWRGFMDMLIPGAHAEELPDRIKELTITLTDLNDSLEKMLMEQMFPGSTTSGGGIGGGGGGGLGVPMNDPKVLGAIKYLMSRGTSMLDAIAIVSNVWSESNLNPKAHNDVAGGHTGIAQLDQSRQRDFQAFEHVPIDHSTVEQQLDFFLHELYGKEKAAFDEMERQTDVGAKADVIKRKFERADDYTMTRARNAQKMLHDYGPMLSGSQSSMVTNNSSSADRHVSMNQTNNVTVNGTGTPQDTARAVKEEQDRHWSDMSRNLGGAFR